MSSEARCAPAAFGTTHVKKVGNVDYIEVMVKAVSAVKIGKRARIFALDGSS